ncbi:MAG TPA: hypothetical protein VMU14_03990 [Acidimicrobiales bacterium]|nr:hypothetical protein [Acidimicrobiales bacterium]
MGTTRARKPGAVRAAWAVVVLAVLAALGWVGFAVAQEESGLGPPVPPQSASDATAPPTLPHHARPLRRRARRR